MMEKPENFAITAVLLEKIKAAATDLKDQESITLPEADGMVLVRGNTKSFEERKENEKILIFPLNDFMPEGDKFFLCSK